MTIGREHKHGILEEKPQPGVCEEPERKGEHSAETPAPAPLVGTTHHVAERRGERSVAETPSGEPSRLFLSDESARFRSRWDSIQTGFVDEPQRAVKQADELVTEVINRLAQVFADERAKLEAKFDAKQHQEVSTEDLRLALRQYRTFFDRLLAV